MYPVLRDQDLVIVRKTVPESLLRGNIVVYRSREDEYIVHRFIERGKDNVLCVRGDGYNLPIESATAETLVGKVMGFVRDRRYNPISRPRELHSWYIAVLKESIKRFSRSVFRKTTCWWKKPYPYFNR